jgi:hypothetical protein
MPTPAKMLIYAQKQRYFCRKMTKNGLKMTAKWAFKGFTPPRFVLAVSLARLPLTRPDNPPMLASCAVVRVGVPRGYTRL